MVMNKRHMITMKRSCSCSMPGVWRAVAHNEGAVVIYHSPKACGHVTRDMELSGYYHFLSRKNFAQKIYIAPLITSNLQDEHSIFGGAEQLRKCVDYVVGKYHPLYIMIANSCVAGVIGDDTQAVASDAETEWQIPIMTVPCCGFLDGEYHAGFYHAAKLLIERFMLPQPKRMEMVTLLGDRGGPHSKDTQELIELLNAFGFNVQCHFPGYATLQDIKAVPASSLLILLAGRQQAYDWMRKLAFDLKEKFAIPFLDYPYPVGWQNTQLWLQKLGEISKKEDEALLTINKQWARLEEILAKCRLLLKPLEIVFCIGRPLIHFQPEWVLELLTLADVKPKAIILLGGLTTEQKQSLRQEIAKQTITVVLDENEGEEVLQQAELILTTHELEDEQRKQFCLPVIPPLGVGGLLFVLQAMLRLARQTSWQGGVYYG